MYGFKRWQIFPMRNKKLAEIFEVFCFRFLANISLITKCIAVILNGSDRGKLFPSDPTQEIVRTKRRFELFKKNRQKLQTQIARFTDFSQVWGGKGNIANLALYKVLKRKLCHIGLLFEQIAFENFHWKLERISNFFVCSFIYKPITGSHGPLNGIKFALTFSLFRGVFTEIWRF